MALMRRSSSGVVPTFGVETQPRKAERSHTSRPTPRSVWPQFCAVSSGMGAPVSVSIASKPPKGVLPREKRRRVIARPPWIRSISPSMGAPFHGR